MSSDLNTSLILGKRALKVSEIKFKNLFFESVFIKNSLSFFKLLFSLFKKLNFFSNSIMYSDCSDIFENLYSSSALF